MTTDFTTENNPRYLYLAELHRPFPDWVSQKPIPSKDDFTKKASAAFADPQRRLLPINTPEAAFHSAINLFACMQDFPASAFDRVKEACASFQIEADVAPYAELFASEMEKTAADTRPPGWFAIDTEIAGSRYQLLPLNSREDVVQSAHDLAKMAAENRINIMLLVPAARELVKAAAQHEVKESLPRVVRFGYERFPEAEKAATLIQGRSAYCKDPSLRSTLDRLYTEALVDLSLDPITTMNKIAAIDHQAGLRVNYREDSAVPTPFDVVFCGPLRSSVEKVAKEHVLVKNDVLVPLASLRNITPIAVEYGLSKVAATQFLRARDSDDARDISLLISNWSDTDKDQLLRLAVKFDKDA